MSIPGYHSLSRRAWIRRVLALAAVSHLQRGAHAAFSQDSSGIPRWRIHPFSELSGIRTPTERFFLRSHLNYPQLDAASWKLRVDGLVGHEKAFSLEQLQDYPSLTQLVTFECAGNSPGGGMLGTAEWRGTPLNRILEQVGVLPETTEVVFEGADYGLDEAESVPLTYTRSIPLEKAIADETVLVWEMNGAPLPPEHGFPVRLVVPGYYAMSHVKWLTRIRMVSEPHRGFYMTKRYFTARRVPGTGEFEITPELRMKLKSQIARPASGEQLSGQASLLSGAAWTGDGIVTRIEVSTDAGGTWSPAEILDDPLPYAWRRWNYLWRDPSNGAHTLVCRAFDDKGNRQPEWPDNSVINRYGNNWYHRVEVTVRRA